MVIDQNWAAPAGDSERIPAGGLDDPRRRLELIRHIVAMANSGGGTIVLGVRRDGDVVGLPREADRFEAAELMELVATHVRPDRVELTVTSIEQPADRSVVEISVLGHPEPPLVMARAGVYHRGGGIGPEEGDGTAVEVFAANQVVVRRNGRSEIARRSDYVGWRSEAIDDLRRELYERLALVVEAPRGATVRVVTEDEVRDEPTYFLTRSTELFRLQPEQLLSSRDLVYLWLHRRTLPITDDAAALLLHSALRKRATLYLWLAALPVSADRVRRLLFEAVGMSDRDKSDAARAVLLVCALYLDAEAYDALVAELRASTYAHMRRAADALPDIEGAQAQLEIERSIGRGQTELPSATDDALYDQVDHLLARGGTVPRRVSSFGLELLRRKLERGGAERQP